MRTAFQVCLNKKTWNLCWGFCKDTLANVQIKALITTSQTNQRTSKIQKRQKCSFPSYQIISTTETKAILDWIWIASTKELKGHYLWHLILLVTQWSKLKDLAAATLSKAEALMWECKASEATILRKSSRLPSRVLSHNGSNKTDLSRIR